MFTNAQEMLSFNHEGRQLRVPEFGSWVEFDCTNCGAHTEEVIDGGALCCSGCDAFAGIPAEWTPDQVCDICHQQITNGESFSDDGGEIAHTACVSNWFRSNYGRETLAS